MKSNAAKAQHCCSRTSDPVSRSALLVEGLIGMDTNIHGRSDARIGLGVGVLVVLVLVRGGVQGLLCRGGGHSIPITVIIVTVLVMNVAMLPLVAVAGCTRMLLVLLVMKLQLCPHRHGPGHRDCRYKRVGDIEDKHVETHRVQNLLLLVHHAGQQRLRDGVDRRVLPIHHLQTYTDSGQAITSRHTTSHHITESHVPACSTCERSCATASVCRVSWPSGTDTHRRTAEW
jgi:hypothetical protein